MTTVRDLGSARERWFLIDTTHRGGQERAARAFEGTSPAGWLPATVPGLAAQDLLREGRIADPYWGNQVNQARWIEERDFVYRTTFEVSSADSARSARLVFESLDTFAVVYLNGELVARHENQFRRLFVDVSGKLCAGKNTLAVAFEAGMAGTVRRAREKLPYWNEPWERLWVRKSQMSFGWDWAARTPTVGIAGSVQLEFADGIWAEDLHARGVLEGDGSGSIKLGVPLKARGAQRLEAELLLDGQVVARSAFELAAGQEQTLELETRIENPELWYPRELGEPRLYRAELRLLGESGVLHEARAKVGIRKIELVKRDPASPNGRVFYLKVNGKRLWAKGDNWLPLDFLHTRVTSEQYRSYLELLMAGGVNMIRVWGGGIVEHAPFYESCDELGLLVWQDFHFACGLYPNTPEFLDEIRKEAEDIVKRLRSHPSLALWCGNNENEVLSLPAGPEARFHAIYYDVLPSVCAALDADRAYWPGSPASESREVHPDSDQEGDRHNWDVWFGWKRTERITDEARFNSEFGAQSFPQRESLESFIHPDETWSPGAVNRFEGPSPGLLFARHGAQLEKLFGQAGAYGPIWDLDAAIATTQIFQAETIGRYIRHYRRNVSYSGGVIVWNYTSTWPSICWALVDWYRRPKHAYYECKRLFRALAVGIEPVDDGEKSYAASVSHDREGHAQGELVLELRNIESGKLVVGTKSRVELGSFQASEPLALEISNDIDRSRHALVATFGEARDIRYLAPLGRMQGFHGRVSAEYTQGKVKLHSSGWRTRVAVEAYESPLVWSDNYIDLLPGETRTLEVAYGQAPERLWLVADARGRRKALCSGERAEFA